LRNRCSTIRASQCVAADLVPAGPAERHRRIAAAVEEQQRLFARLEPRRDRARSVGEIQRPRRQVLGAHVDGAHLGQHRRAEPRRQVEPRVFARLGIGPALQRRRGRGQHHLRPVQIEARSTAMSRAL
jgi:hypothetical protein